MTITFRAKESGVEIQVHEIVSENGIYWELRLAPSVDYIYLRKRQWERVVPAPASQT